MQQQKTSKYSKSKIYKIVSDSSDKIYIGSTTSERLCKRLAEHVNNYKEYSGSKKHSHYITSYELLKNNDFQIILLENVPCLSRDELNAHERRHQDQNKDKIVNKARSKISEEEREKSRKEYYYNVACERRKAKNACKCGGMYTIEHKSTHEKTKLHKKYIETTENL